MRSLFVPALLLAGCTIHTYSGSTLPAAGFREQSAPRMVFARDVGRERTTGREPRADGREVSAASTQAGSQVVSSPRPSATMPSAREASSSVPDGSGLRGGRGSTGATSTTKSSSGAKRTTRPRSHAGKVMLASTTRAREANDRSTKGAVAVLKGSRGLGAWPSASHDGANDRLSRPALALRSAQARADDQDASGDERADAASSDEMQQLAPSARAERPRRDDRAEALTR